METIERIFWNWCKLWFVIAGAICVGIWYQGFAHTSQPVVDIIVVGILGACASLAVPVVIPGIVIGNIVDTRIRREANAAIENSIGVDGDGI